MEWRRCVGRGAEWRGEGGTRRRRAQNAGLQSGCRKREGWAVGRTKIDCLFVPSLTSGTRPGIRLGTLASKQKIQRFVTLASQIGDVRPAASARPRVGPGIDRPRAPTAEWRALARYVCPGKLKPGNHMYSTPAQSLIDPSACLRVSRDTHIASSFWRGFEGGIFPGGI